MSLERDSGVVECGADEYDTAACSGGGSWCVG